MLFVDRTTELVLVKTFSVSGSTETEKLDCQTVFARKRSSKNEDRDSNSVTNVFILFIFLQIWAATLAKTSTQKING